MRPVTGRRTGRGVERSTKWWPNQLEVGLVLMRTCGDLRGGESESLFELDDLRIQHPCERAECDTQEHVGVSFVGE